MTQPPKPGVHYGVPFSEYRQWDAINPSFLTTLSNETPYHAKYDLNHPKPETDATRVGRALHSKILEPATFDDFWTVLTEDPPRRPSDRQRNAKTPSAATLAAIEFWDGIAASGKDIIKPKEYALVTAMAKEVCRQQCVNLVSGGKAEVCIVWQDPDTGLTCKSRLDYERSYGWNHFITDLKSSRDINPRRFQNDIPKFGYALAAAMRIDGWRILTGDDSKYDLLAVDKGYCVAWTKEVDEDTIEAGRDDYSKALERTAECMETGVWPAYGQDVGFIRAPEWYLREHGVGPYNMRPEPAGGPKYAPGEEPEHDEIDDFLKGD